MRTQWASRVMLRDMAVLVAFLVIALIPSPGHAPSHTLYVNNTDPTCQGQAPCYSTIQAAINAAQSGDLVVIQAGTYPEQLSIQGKNNFSGASELHRILIEADPGTTVGNVVLTGAVTQCTNGHAIRLSQSKFITIRGLTITGAGGQAISLLGGNNQNQAIHIERNRIFGNGSSECNGGITIARGNPGTLIVNNLSYANGRNGIAFIDADGGPHYIVENTIHANAWSGVNVARSHEVFLVNNLITGNGTASGSTGGRFGVSREGSTSPQPVGIHLLNNIVCGNRLGEINGPALDGTDSGNLTPTGSEGLGVSASPGCNVPGNVYAHVNGADGQPSTIDDNFTLAATSPALDRGRDPRTLGLDLAFNPIFEADSTNDAARPRPGTSTATAQFDIGALEFEVPDAQAPSVSFLQPAANAWVRQSITVEAQATDNVAVASFALSVDSQPLSATLTPQPPSSPITTAATLNTTNLADGAHTLAATATDQATNSATASRVILIDNTPPETDIIEGPTGTISETSATFAWSGTDNLTPQGNLVFAWRFDSGAWSPFSAGTSTKLPNLTEGPHTFEVKARDLAGNEDPTPAQRAFTVTLSQVRVTITEPANGASVPAGQLLVRGTVEANGVEAGVTVNGIPAAVQGTAFAALVTVDSSTTTLTALATTATGATATHSVTLSVNPAAETELTLRASPANGTAPLAVAFSLSGFAVPATIELDLDGNGTVDFVGSTLESQTFTYSQPGTYIPTARVTDALGTRFIARAMVQIFDRAAFDTFLRGKWASFKSALGRGDVDAAVSFIVDGEKDKYRAAFQDLSPDLPAFATRLQDLSFVSFQGEIAEYVTPLLDGGVTFIHFVYFMQDTDGLWKIVAM